MALRMLLLIVATMAAWVPEAKTGAGGSKNPVWVDCPKCGQRCNIVNVMGGPWKCPHCKETNNK